MGVNGAGKTTLVKLLCGLYAPTQGRILVFDGGRLVQEGSHEELLGDTEGKYYQLWKSQEQYYR